MSEVTSVPAAPGFIVPMEMRATGEVVASVTSETVTITEYAVPLPRLVTTSCRDVVPPLETVALPSEREVGTTSGFGPVAAFAGAIYARSVASKRGKIQPYRGESKTRIVISSRSFFRRRFRPLLRQPGDQTLRSDP